MHRDENLLFGVFAVQLKLVTPSQIMEAAGAWATDPSKDLPGRLVEMQALKEQDRDLIDQFVEKAVETHGGDVSKTLASFGGPAQVSRSFCGSIAVSETGHVTKARAWGALLSSADPNSVPGVDEYPGRYTRESEHARGGMGRVLLVHDEHLGRDIALKELLPEPADESQSKHPSPVRMSGPHMARFLQEARITSQLEHPSVVPVYELGHREDGTLYYTMKLVRGRALSEAIRDANTLRERLKLLSHFADLCQAIAYAHSRGVIHRDIKPDNVMVGEFGETVVIDWGLSKARGQDDVHAEGLRETLRVMSLGDEGERTKTVYGKAIGTPTYMPPEQAKGQLDQIDERSDVYSLGAVLYEILSGQVPFQGKDLAEILTKAATDTPAPILEAEPDAPPELVAVCDRSMQRDPARRYQSARDLAEDVQRFQRGAAVAAYKYSYPEIFRRFAEKYRAILATSGFALLVLVIGAGYSYTSLLYEKNVAIDARNETEGARIAETKALQNEREARARAETEAELSDEVVEFMVGMFVSADDVAAFVTVNPWRVVDPVNPSKVPSSITLREFLDFGAEEIESGLERHPEVQARLKGIIGGVYTYIGVPDQALPLLESALEMQRSLHGDAHPRSLEAAYLLSMCYYALEDFEKAIANTLHSLQILEGNLPEGYDWDEWILVLKNSLARIHWSMGDTDTAVSYAREVLELHRSSDDDLFDLYTENMIIFLRTEASNRYFKGSTAGAEKLYLEALDLQRELWGPTDEGFIKAEKEFERLFRKTEKQP